MSSIDIALLRGDYRTELEYVECDTLISDPPYSERTHSAYREMHEVNRRALDYACMTPDDVRAYVEFWSERTRGWMVVLSDDVLAPVWRQAMEDAGRYSFAPLACVEPGSRVRITGDGPSNWTVYAMVSRPKTMRFKQWGALVGAYVVPFGQTRRGKHEGQGVMGGKPIWLMRALVRDYSRPGDLICDPCAGGATTLLAARAEGRKAIGAELDPDTHAFGLKRLAQPYMQNLFVDELRARARPQQQHELELLPKIYVGDSPNARAKNINAHKRRATQKAKSK